MRILITGANGFVGKNLCSALIAEGHEVSAAVRRPGFAPPGTKEVVVADIVTFESWVQLLEGNAAVIHLAARVHVMEETASDPLLEFRRTNTEGTLSLACAAQSAGVSRFIFLSSIKTNGEGTTATPFSVDDVPAPQDPYAVSKWEAEQGLSALAETSAMGIAIIRTPLIYGPGVGGNFRRLIELGDRRVPIPLASVKNCRSMISVWNLADLIGYLLITTMPAHQTILASDEAGFSTASLIRSIGRGLGKRATLVWCPVWILRLAGFALGKRAEIDRLVGSLELVTGSTAEGFEWNPPIAAPDAIERTTIAWIKSSTSDRVV